MERLRAGLQRVSAGRGSAFLVLGQGGMGKTRLLRWLEHEAQGRGVQVHWGNGLKEAIAPFFVFEQILRRSSATSGRAGTPAKGEADLPPLSDLTPYVLYEEERPRMIRSVASHGGGGAPVLWISRENPSAAKERAPLMPGGSRSLWMTRMEGEGKVNPSNLEALGEAASGHLKAHSGGLVALEGVEYLCSQNGFAPVLKLLQFLRDLAQDAGGHLLVSVNPGAFEKREVSLLESDAEVHRSFASPASPRETVPSGPEPVATALLRYLRMVEEAARTSPQVLVIDDMHWVDAPSGTAFQFLVRNTRDLPVMMVAGAREEEISREGDDQGVSLADRLQSIERDGLLERLPLPPFDVEETRRLAQEVLGAPLQEGSADSEVRELVRRTSGNPYFLREILLQLKEHGLLVEGEGRFRFLRPLGSIDAAQVPTSLRRLVLQRLSLLSPEERSFLDTAAVAGSEFPLEPVASVRHMETRDARRMVHDLEGRWRLIEGISEGVESWSFSHPLVWEVTISEMTPATRRGEAQSLLSWWEEHRPGEVATLARLAHDGGDARRGLPWIRQALDEALRATSPEAAATYLEWLQDLRRGEAAPAESSSIQAEVEAARRLSRAGGSRAACRFLERLLLEPLALEQQWDAKAALAFASEPTDSREARQQLDALLAEISRSSTPVPPRLRRLLDQEQSGLLAQEGKTEELLRLLRETIQAPAGSVEEDDRVRALSIAAWSEMNLGHRSVAEEYLRRASAYAGQDPSTLAGLAHIDALFHVARGDRQGAVRSALRAAEEFRRAGHLTQASINEYNAGELMIELNQLERGERVARDLLDLGRKFDLPRIRCSGLFLLARGEAKRGRYPAALKWAEESLREAEGTHRLDDVRDCQILVAQLRGKLGDVEGALREYERLDAEGAFAVVGVAIDVLPEIAGLHVQRGSTRKARELYTRALQMSRDLGNADREKELLAALELLPPEGSTPSDSSKPL